MIITGIPSPVRNCTAVNVSTCCASIECLPGWNGGLEQSFTIEVLEEETEEEEQRKGLEKSRIKTRGGDTEISADVGGAPLVLANTASSPHPVFVVEGLKGERKYLVSVRAVNAKGHSDESILTIVTNREGQEKQIQAGE